MAHVGSYIFRGSMAALSHIEASATSSAESNQKFYQKQKQKPKKKKQAFRP